MKTLTRLLTLCGFLFLVFACSDITGDGMDTVPWDGSVLPEASGYRNPVWEPDLEEPCVIRGATQFYAFGNEKEFSPGLNFRVPVLRSANLMNWDMSGEAFEEGPGWTEGEYRSVSGIFSRTLGTYYMAYAIEGQGIGTAFSRTPQGPYTDYGKLMDPASSGFAYVAKPFLIQSGLDFYLFFDTDLGVHGIELTIARNNPPALSGEPFRVTGTDIHGVFIHRKSADSYYLFGTVGDDSGSEIVVGRSGDIEGPYTDQSGTELLSGQGTRLVEGDAESGYVAPGHVGGVFTDRNGTDWIMYQASDMDKEVLSSGNRRRPMMLSPVGWNDEGWPAGVIRATGGWNTPKFEF